MDKILKFNMEEVREKLSSKKSADRCSAAKKIGKYLIKELNNELYLAYIKEKEDIRTWSTQCEMIKSLGKLGNKNVIPELERIIQENKNDDTITSTASLAYVRIKKAQKYDASSVIDLLRKGNLSVIYGAVFALAYDDMVPESMQIQEILNIMLNREQEITKMQEGDGHSIDPRSYVLSALIKWDKSEPLVQKFIDRTLKLDSIKNDTFVMKKFSANKKIYEE